MTDIQPMTWDEAEYYENGYAQIGNPYREDHPAHDWLGRAIRAIALARQEKERADRAKESKDLAEQEM